MFLFKEVYALSVLAIDSCATSRYISLLVKKFFVCNKQVHLVLEA
jgi:hypothetical protein